MSKTSLRPSENHITNKRHSPFSPLFPSLCLSSGVSATPPFSFLSPPPFSTLSASRTLPLCVCLIALSGSGSGIQECLLFLFCVATSVVALSLWHTRCRLILPYDTTPVSFHLLLLPRASALTRLLHALRPAGVTIPSDSCPSMEASLRSLSTSSLPLPIHLWP